MTDHHWLSALDLLSPLVLSWDNRSNFFWGQLILCQWQLNTQLNTHFHSLRYKHSTNGVWPLHLTSSILICTGNTSAKKAKGGPLHTVCWRSSTVRAGVMASLIHSSSKEFNSSAYTDLSSSANTHCRVIIVKAACGYSSFCNTVLRCSVFLPWWD